MIAPFVDPARSIRGESGSRPARAFLVRGGTVRLHVVEAGRRAVRPISCSTAFPSSGGDSASSSRRSPAGSGGDRARPARLQPERQARRHRLVPQSVLVADLLALLDDLGIERTSRRRSRLGWSARWLDGARSIRSASTRAGSSTPTLVGDQARRSGRAREQRRRGALPVLFPAPVPAGAADPARRNDRAFRSIFKRSSPPGTFTSAELERSTPLQPPGPARSGDAQLVPGRRLAAAAAPTAGGAVRSRRRSA